MRAFDEYYFVYANAYLEWDTCSNPVFIAKHKLCRAVPKDTNVKELIQLLNENSIYISNDIYGLNLDGLIEKFIGRSTI